MSEIRYTEAGETRDANTARSLDDLLEAAILEKVERIAEQLAGRELMDSHEAADFLRLPYDQFKRLAPSIPRHAITERRFVYARSELLEWALSQPGRGKEPWEC